jgi:uncharacterized protein with HEPN domain
LIGEAARPVSREFTATHPEISWENIVGVRRKGVHDDLGVDEGIVWQVVTEQLPKLLQALEPPVPPAVPRGRRLRPAIRMTAAFPRVPLH